MQLSIRSEVSYSIAAGPCTFVFNVEATDLGGQRVRRESLSLTPDTGCDRFKSYELGNRYLSCNLLDG